MIALLDKYPHKLRYQLINEDSKSWNERLIEELFYEHDAQAILQIEIPRTETEDPMAWHYEKNGCFTVKSAYRFDFTLKNQARGKRR
jgi:hypothetical protein